MVDQKEHDAALALRIIDYLKLIRSTSHFGCITFKIRNDEIQSAELTISDHRSFSLDKTHKA